MHALCSVENDECNFIHVRGEELILAVFRNGTIKSSINLPAQSFYQSRKVLLELCDRANIREVIFYCGGPTYITSPFSRHISHIAHIGASNGRGPRCAAWMQDYIDDISKFGRKTNLKVFTLKGGIKGWVKDFEGALVDGFVEGYWEQFK